jgi:hypothetical protein
MTTKPTGSRFRHLPATADPGSGSRHRTRFESSLSELLCRFSFSVSYRDAVTSSDGSCLTRCHLAAVSGSCHFFRATQTCSCDGCASCSCRRADACSSRTVFVLTVRTARRRKPTPIARNMVVVDADALVRLTRAVPPAISPTPAPVSTPPRESDHRDSNLRIALRGQIRHSDVLPHRRAEYTQYSWAAMNLRHR